MNKIKRALFWAVANASFAWALWAGYVAGIAGGHHLAVFMVWFSFIGSMVVFSKDVCEKMIAKGPPVPAMLDGAFDACVVGFLVWHGAVFLGVIYLLHTLFVHGTYQAERATTP